MGRSLVRASLREFEEYERQNAAGAGAASTENNERKVAVVAAPRPRSSNALRYNMKKIAPVATAPTATRSSSFSSSSYRYNQQQPYFQVIPSRIVPPKLVFADSRVEAFFELQNFLSKTIMHRSWRQANGFEDPAPSDLFRHIGEAIVVFSFQREDSVVVLGASLYRRSKVTRQMEQECQLVLRMEGQHCQHVIRWSDWTPTGTPNEKLRSMRNGLLGWMIQRYLTKPIKEPKRICVLNNDEDLRCKDHECGLDWRHDLSHYVFAMNDDSSFPAISQWITTYDV